MVVYDEFYRANAAFINARQAQMAANQPVIEGEQRADIGTVDWSKPIEAVHVDGRVAPACVASGKPVGWAYCSATSEDGIWHYGLSGTSSWRGWHIRNVQTPEATQPAIDPALVERMVALVRDIATLNGQLHQYQDRATDILKALDPVDPDQAIAEEIAASFNEGEYEAVALAAIKRGRELERERGEAK